MPDKEWYKSWFDSRYYDILYRNRDEAADMTFIQTLIRYLDPLKGATMLDVACGKGWHTKGLSEMGFDVTGIDISAPSIEMAKSYENETLHFYQHDMRLPFWINYYDYAFNFFTSFGYFRTRREHDNAIRTIAQSLKHGGLFVIDYLNVRYEEKRLKQTSVTTMDDITFHIARWQDEDNFYKQIQVSDKDNKTLRHINTEKVARFSLGDFTDMFSYQGMQIQEVFGDYQLGRYDIRKSPRMIILAKRV